MSQAACLDKCFELRRIRAKLLTREAQAHLHWGAGQLAAVGADATH